MTAHARMLPLPGSLACGCLPGYVQCRRAVALWERVNDAYAIGVVTGNWRRYEQAKAAFDRHIGQPVTVAPSSSRVQNGV